MCIGICESILSFKMEIDEDKIGRELNANLFDKTKYFTANNKDIINDKMNYLCVWPCLLDNTNKCVCKGVISAVHNTMNSQSNKELDLREKRSINDNTKVRMHEEKDEIKYKLNTNTFRNTYYNTKNDKELNRNISRKNTGTWNITNDKELNTNIASKNASTWNMTNDKELNTNISSKNTDAWNMKYDKSITYKGTNEIKREVNKNIYNKHENSTIHNKKKDAFKEKYDKEHAGVHDYFKKMDVD